MSKSLKWDWDYLLHYLGGFGINGTLVATPIILFDLQWWISIIGVIAVTIFGWVREKIQHNWDALSLHQNIEAFTWTAGALTAAGILAFL